MESSHGRHPLVLVTGVTGYIGGRLVPELLAAGYACARHDAAATESRWTVSGTTRWTSSRVTPRTRAPSLPRYVGVDVAYYLIHSVGTGARLRRARPGQCRELRRAAARSCRVGRIVYLGGLYPDAEPLSPHLQSRKEVGEIFLSSGVPTVVLRAAVILGSGSRVL